jgi:ADP-ribose pyrophosphatase YjhB (NUDIX family)
MSHNQKHPYPAVDIIVEREDGVVLIKRRNPPSGWALPGGFVEYGESCEECAVREAKEETGLDVELIEQFHTYSDPDRDPRFHTISIVFVARAEGELSAGDDAGDVRVFRLDELPEDMAFDHKKILEDYKRRKE